MPAEHEAPAAAEPEPDASPEPSVHEEREKPYEPEVSSQSEDRKNPEPDSPDPVGKDFWPDISQQAKSVLPRDMAALLPMAAGHVEGSTLVVEVEPGFYFTRFNRPEIMDSLSQVASEILGFSVNAKVREKKKEVKKPRSLDELRQYKEVRFV